MFRSEGKNDKSDNGYGDDIDIIYIDDKRVEKEYFLSWAEENVDPVFWEVYQVIFIKPNNDST